MELYPNNSMLTLAEDLLDAEGVPEPTVRLENPAEIYQRFTQLPDAVKDLFFSRAAADPEMPFSLGRAFLMAIDDRTWHCLKRLSCTRSKKLFNLVACEQVKRFVDHERQNGLLLGKSPGKLIPFGKLPRLSQKENALLQLTKPQKWVKKLGVEEPNAQGAFSRNAEKKSP